MKDLPHSEREEKMALSAPPWLPPWKAEKVSWHIPVPVGRDRALLVSTELGLSQAKMTLGWFSRERKLLLQLPTFVVVTSECHFPDPLA